MRGTSIFRQKCSNVKIRLKTNINIERKITKDLKNGEPSLPSPLGVPCSEASVTLQLCQVMHDFFLALAQGSLS